MAILIEKNPSSSTPGLIYTTRLDTSTGEASCDCRGWTTKKEGKPRSCTHTKRITAANGGAVAAVSALATMPRVERAKADGPLPLLKSELAAPVRVAAPGAPTVKPMLASAFPEGSTLADFGAGWVLEEKFDGHRLFVVVRDGKVTGWSRPGADRPSIERPLPAALVEDAKKMPDGTYDSELNKPGGTSSDVTRLDQKDALVLTLFDAIEIMGVSLLDKPLTYRRAALEVAVKHAPEGGRVRIAEQTAVSLDTVKAIWARGGEGAILKKTDSTYRSGWRTPNWVKVKAIGSAELTLTGFGDGKNGPQSVMELRHDDGRVTTVKVLGNEWLRIFNADPKKYVGRRVTISFMGMTSGNLWRHPQFDHFVQEF